MKWYKRDPSAALAGMAGMTLEERGAYNVLLDLIYARDGNVPDDERFLRINLGCDIRTWRRLKARLIELGKIAIEGGLIVNFRATSELKSARSRMEVDRDRREKAKTIKETELENRSILTTTTTTRKKETHTAPAAPSERDQEFEEFWEAYPKREGPNPKAAAKKKYLLARRKGASSKDLLSAVGAFADQMYRNKTEPRFVPQAATWLNQERWSDYTEAVDDSAKLLEFHRQQCLVGLKNGLG